MNSRKKRLLLLLTTLFLFLGLALQPVYALFLPPIKMDITDKLTDPIFKAEVKQLLGKGYFDKIYNTDVNGIKHLDLGKKGISSLDGIEYFTGLEVLIADENKLTKLDLTNNSKVYWLRCAYNENLTTLNLGNNSALYFLSCRNTALKALDLSGIPKLKEFYCQNNELTSLDISKNTQLDYIDCSGNKLTSLNIGNNAKLRALECRNNKFTYLDLGQNPKLEVAYVSYNELTSLDTSSNYGLIDLDVNSNNLMSLNVSNNPNLEYLKCKGNRLSSEDVIIGLNKSKLQWFEFDNQQPKATEPTKFSAKAGDEQVELSWSPPVYEGTGPLLNYGVSVDNGSTWTTVGNVTKYTVSGLENGKSYTFKLRAVNKNGAGLEASLIATPVAASKPPLFEYGEASSWAIPELDKAVVADLIPMILSGKNMTKAITREEFAELAVRLYEKSTGKTIIVLQANPFTDTNNPQILKAYQIGITSGTSATKFSPDVLIPREQCATMLYRAIQAISPKANYSIAGVPDFPDQKYIADWAVEATKYMSKLGIILGNTQGEFMPKPLNNAHKLTGHGMATREAAVLMTVRTFEKIK